MESVSKLAPGAGRRAEKQWRARGSSLVRPREFRVKGHGVIYLGSQSVPVSLVISPLIRREPRARKGSEDTEDRHPCLPAHACRPERNLGCVFPVLPCTARDLEIAKKRVIRKEGEPLTTQRSGASPSKADEQARLRVGRLHREASRFEPNFPTLRFTRPYLIVLRSSASIAVVSTVISREADAIRERA
jgi:hypothetical protein